MKAVLCKKAGIVKAVGSEVNTFKPGDPPVGMALPQESFPFLTLRVHYVKFSIMEKNDLLVTAAQAQLDLSAEEESRLSSAVTEMLDYFELMNEVDVSNLAPTTHALVRENALRPDNSNNNSNPDSNMQGALIAAAPESEDNFIVIPNVL